MDSKTGSLTITDLETEHTGEFRLKIYSDRRIVFKRFTVTVSASGLSPGAVAGICIFILLIAAAAAGVVIYFQSDHYKAKKLMYEADVNENIKSLTDNVETSEQETRDDVTPAETPTSEIREGERERFIFVEETAISKAFGADKILRDKRGRKSIAIRAEDDEVETHDLTDDVKISEQETRSDGKAPGNELKEHKEESTGKDVNEETPFMSQKEEDGSNE
ncbi:hypothetical protein cypCar_00025645 [Cyprinus carpio]|nr:hypothetical protein cypCar_00025645 [Cyprinus carpio]